MSYPFPFPREVVVHPVLLHSKFVKGSDYFIFLSSEKRERGGIDISPLPTRQAGCNVSSNFAFRSKLY